MNTATSTHLLPPLPYPAAALAPHIDERTMLLHHDMHHASYVNALNAVLEPFPELTGKSAEWLLLNIHKVPQKIRARVRQNAGGHLNHSLLWSAMMPAGDAVPAGPLAEAITLAFGSLDEFKREFEETGAALFGSGWVWLVAPAHGDRRLQIAVTSGHDNPVLDSQYPILVNDVWEHAYYLQHQNRRADYLRGWWSIVNWPEAERRFTNSPQANPVSVAPARAEPLHIVS